MLPDDHPDRIQIAFDDHRLVVNAGLLLPATLALHLGLPQLVDRHLGLGRWAGPSQHRRQGDDAGGVCAGGRIMHGVYVRGHGSFPPLRSAEMFIRSDCANADRWGWAGKNPAGCDG